MSKVNLADKINWLFENIRHPSGREYRYEEVEAATAENGRKITISYLSKLRRGEQNNPNWTVIRSLAQFFNVPVTYFYDETLSKDYLDQLKLAASIDPQTRQIALRSGRLSPKKKQAILNLIELLAEDDTTS